MNTAIQKHIFEKTNHKSLVNIVTTMVKTGINHPIYLIGSPGLGKTAIISSLGKEIEAVTGDKYEFVYVSLETMDANEVRGYPKLEKDKAGNEFTIHAPLKKFANPNRNKRIYFFDELPKAKPSTLDAFLNIIHDRRNDDGTIDMTNDIIIAAGNKDTDGIQQNKIPPNMIDRFIAFEMDIEEAIMSFINNYASEKFDPLIIAYLRETPEEAYKYDPQNRGKQVTFRGWDKVSQIEKTDIDRNMKNSLICAAIGPANAQKYIAFVNLKEDLPDIDAILWQDHKKAKYEPLKKETLKKTGTGLRFLIASSMIQKLRFQKDSSKFKNGVINAMEYHLYQLDYGLEADILKTFIMDITKDGLFTDADPKNGLTIKSDFISKYHVKIQNAGLHSIVMED